MPRLPRRPSRTATRLGGLEALEGRSLLSGFAPCQVQYDFNLAINLYGDGVRKLVQYNA